MRADAQKINDVIECFEQQKLRAQPVPVKKLLITHDRRKARVWCEECNYGFITFESWQIHHKENHIAKRA